MIKSKEDYKNYLEMDRLCREEKRLKPRIIGDELWKYRRLLRKLEFYTNVKKGALSKIYRYILKYRHYKMGIRLGISIPINVFDSGLKIMHPGGIMINSNAKVGKNCVLFHGVTIGTTRARGGEPKIGNNVCLASGAKLFGNIELGNNISVGANAVVTKSFKDDGITLAGVPAKIINNKGSDGIIPKVVQEKNK